MSEFRSPPPDPSGMKIDFSEFHPLDHWPWQCGDLPGGWRNHLYMSWHWRRKGDLRAATLCKIGWHREAQWYKGRGEKQVTWTGCADCGKPLSERQPV